MAEFEDAPRGSNDTSDAQTSTNEAIAGAAPAVVSTDAMDDTTASGALRIRLKMLDERVVEVEAELTMSIAHFREKVAHATQVPVYRQRLIYRGKLLKDGTALSAYDIQDGHTVHLVAKPLRSTTSTAAATADALAPTRTRSTATSVSSSSEDDDFVTSTLRRNREHLRRLMSTDDDRQREDATHERAVSAELYEPSVLRASPPQAVAVAPTTTRRRVPGPGDPTGTAWNMGVLREALSSSTSDSDTATAPPRLHGLRELFGDDVLADSPASVASDMGLDPSASSAARPNVDHIFQGLLTLRTVLSTATTPSRALEQQAARDAQRLESYSFSDSDEQTADVANTVVRSANADASRGPRQFFVGQWLDVKDTVNQWLECTVLAVADGQVLVHYHGWPSRWDEWIDCDSPRLAAFRTRTVHTVNATQLSPAPTTRLANAPSIGATDVHDLVTGVRDAMRELLPHIERLAELTRDAPSATLDTNDDVSDAAHLVAPLFDRFGRVLADAARTLEPLYEPELRHYTREREAQQVRAAAARGRTGRQPATQLSAIERRDTSLGVRDLVSTALPLPIDAPARRNIDVHIHAIVAPSSLASLARAASTATRGPSNSNNSRVLTSRSAGPDFDEAFGLPSFRQPLGGADGRALVTDDHDSDDDDDSRNVDASRMPLLSSHRRSDASLGVRRRHTVDETLDQFLAEDFFGTSFGADDSDDDAHDNNAHDTAAPANSRSAYESIPSRPPESASTGRTTAATAATLGVIPEVAEADARVARTLDAAAASGSPTDRTRGDSSASSASASSSRASASSGSGAYPSFLEFMRRSLRRNFGLATRDASDSSASQQRDDGNSDNDDMPALEPSVSSSTVSSAFSASPPRDRTDSERRRASWSDHERSSSSSSSNSSISDHAPLTDEEMDQVD